MFAPAIAALVLFCLATLANWGGNAVGNARLADTSKPLLMPLLALASSLVLLAVPCPKGTVLLLVAALLLHMVGDIFLIPENDKDFMTGATFFLLGHVCYLGIFWRAFTLVGASFFVAMAVVIVVVAAVMGIAMRKKPALFVVGTPVYAAVLFTLMFAGLAGTLAGYSAGSPFLLAGGILFIVSDAILTYSRFVKKFPLSGFFVMLTYVCAEVLIVCGAVVPCLP